jgi:uncharacterized membrane protein
MNRVIKYFKRIGGGDHEIRIWRSQLSIILLYIVALSVSFFKNEFLAVFVVLFALIPLLGFTKFNTAEKYFFGGLVLLGVALSTTGFLFANFNFALLVAYIVAFAVFFTIFYFKFKHEFVEGVVEAYSGKWVVLHVHYDLQSGVHQGWYAVRTKHKLRKGQKVKARVKSVMGERVPWEIIK